MKVRRTIEEILDLKTGKTFEAEDFLRKPFDELTIIRSELEKANQGLSNRWLACAVCGENLRMLGGKNKRESARSKNWHFAHFHNSKDCPIKTSSRYTREDINRMKYRGASESELHISLKNKIAESLYLNQISKKQVMSITIEKVIRSLDEQEWRKPDISTVFKEDRIAIELQLSTTWLDVITARQHFYKQQRMFILWIFNDFEGSDDFRKLTYSDIIYTNNSNAFIFNKESHEKSVTQNDLVLKCYYREYYADYDKVRYHWKTSFVTLSQLCFDRTNFIIYFFDSATSKLEAKQEVENYVKRQKERERQEQLEHDKLVIAKHDAQEKLKAAEYDQENLQENLKDLSRTISSLDEKYRQYQSKEALCEEEAKLLYSRIEFLSRHTVPASMLENVEFYQKQYKSIVEKLKSLNAQVRDRDSRLARIKKLDTKTIGGVTYQILDKIHDWDFIQHHHQDLFCFNTDQVSNLFTEPKVQRVVQFQLAQIQFNRTVLILADFRMKVSEHETHLSELKNEISNWEKELELLKPAFCESISKQLRSLYNESLQMTGEQIELCREQIKTCELEIKNKRTLQSHFRIELEKYKYVYED